MTSVKIKLNTQRITKKGYPIVIQIIHNRRKKLIPTNFHVADNEFDNHSSVVVTKSRSTKVRAWVDQTNYTLKQITLKLETAIEALNQINDTYSINDIINSYNTYENKRYFKTYAYTLISEFKKHNNHGTAIAYKSMIGKLQAFRGNDQLMLQDINNKMVCGFEQYLQKEGLKTNTVNFHIRILKAIYNRAIYEGIITDNNNPFRGIVLKASRTPKRAVTKGVIRQIIELDLSQSAHLAQARDIFLFSFYSRGMPFVDCAFLTNANIRGNFIEYSRHKTGQSLQVELNPQLRDILNKYCNQSPYLLPILSDQNPKPLYNQYLNALRNHNKRLQCIGDILGISLSSYVSRHSWATIAKHSGIPLSVISEGLGHASEKTTYSYLSSFETSVLSRANDIVVNLTE